MEGLHLPDSIIIELDSRAIAESRCHKMYSISDELTRTECLRCNQNNRREQHVYIVFISATLSFCHFNDIACVSGKKLRWAETCSKKMIEQCQLQWLSQIVFGMKMFGHYSNITRCAKLLGTCHSKIK